MMYVAYKIQGFHFWVWFEKEKVVDTGVGGDIVGREGWGSGGARVVRLEVLRSLIEGTMESDVLQYEDNG